jgi:hypothetical protein
MPATTMLPGLSQIHAWDTEHLEAAATHWTTTAHTWEDAFTKVYQEAQCPGGTPWDGEAADAAVLRVGTDRLQVLGAVDSLHTAASVARNGASELQAAKQLALEAVAQAQASGFTVGEDLSVTSPPISALPAVQVARQAQAQALAANIRSRAAALAGLDQQVAGQITTATAGLSGIQFGQSPILPGQPPKNGRGPVQSVDYRNKPPQGPPPPPPPPGGDGLPQPGGGYGSYHYGFQFGTSQAWTKQDIVKEIAQNYNKYFTFTGDQPSIVEGETINLRGPLGEPEPVKVTSVTDSGFSFVSLPGHTEGGGRTIVFSVVPAQSNPIPNVLNWELRVEAAGPISGMSTVPGADLADKFVWQNFATNLATRLPAFPPGSVPTTF